MTKIVKYEMNEEEHNRILNSLDLMSEKLEHEVKRLGDIPNNKRTDSENISLNNYEYLKHMLFDIKRVM